MRGVAGAEGQDVVFLSESVSKFLHADVCGYFSHDISLVDQLSCEESRQLRARKTSQSIGGQAKRQLDIR